jgi:hypothetical protein
MANLNNPRGLSPLVKNQGGGPCQANAYKKVVGTATVIYQNDCVRPLAAGDITAGGTPGTDLWLGVALNYGAASTATDHLVIDDPSALFEAQDDGQSSGLLEADQRLNANLIFPTAIALNALLQISSHGINASTKATTATLDVKLLRKLSDIAILGGGGAEFGQYSRFEVMFNQHVYKQTGAGV